MGLITNPYGMSFFLAAVPRGVNLRHSAPHNVSVQGTEWLEEEHALRFAWNICGCDDPGYSFDDQQSVKWAFPRYLAGFPPSVGVQSRSQPVLKTLPLNGPPPICIAPGYLQTYKTSRDLRLLYVEGEAAYEPRNDTLDSKDHNLPHEFPKA